jgi:hypothetical protein
LIGFLEEIMGKKATDRAARSMMAVMLMLVAWVPADLVISTANAQTSSPPGKIGVEAAVVAVDKVLADPSKKEALCAYARARGAVGAAAPNQAPGITGQFRTLGSAQGAERQAAAAVDPEFQRAVENLRVGDYMQAIRVELALQTLCKPQQ